MYFLSERPRFTLLNFPKHFFSVYCIFLPFLFRGLAPSTEGGRYLKSQGGATGHFPFPRSPALATRYDQNSTVLADLRQRPGLPPALSGSCSTCPPANGAAFQVFLGSWPLLLLDDRALPPLPSTLPPSSQPRQLMSGVIKTPLPTIIHQFMMDSRPPPLDSLIAVVRPYLSHWTRGWSDLTEISGARSLHRDNSNVLEPPDAAPLPIVLERSRTPSSIRNFSSTRPYELSRSRQSCIPVFSLIISCFPSRFANGPFGCVCFYSLVSRAIRTTMFSISLVFHVLQLYIDECPSFPLTFRVCSLSCLFPHSVLS